ncbi:MULTISPECIES: cell division ATP-binding protein FtsE [Gammaproteobacteria]|uniref:Cell division ATP-binding protein FtsE n=1 Tax=Vreelandella halophila TaxID=86177 RepID=A0A9X5B527_9GAMM|nr:MULTISPECIES: cell division ATP-binding protein FtsE [Gammaproteobacteria]KAA8982827.1 cell division ATP-binding protein FtsE [Halospina sp. K52047b]MYL26008.1 cell division ATP-binding protein FtsE [Halomonas utahensis]MYL73430.1 cell division ATP-binding protein FtsE [Halomonas sp. 22501_18_FS]
MIEFRQVTKRYEQQFTALRGVSFALGRGEMAFLTGHSGAGKSTLLKLIMLMERATAGQVLVGGQALEKTPRRRIPYIRRHIGVVFQDHQLLFDRTVFDNVAMPLQVTGVPPNEIGRRVRAALDKVGLLKKEQLNPISLSGGEQQRVGIARAVVNKPPLLLADEPTGNLDPALSSEIMDLFREFSRVGVCVMVATHDIGLIETMAQRTLELSGGELVQDGLPTALETRHG